MKRLYTFGCSYTNYKWPTWADFIATQFDYFENWGKSGAGNYYITSKILECNQINKFTKNDTILIMITSFTRFDMISRDSVFHTHGNLYVQNYYEEKFIENFWSEEFGFHMTWFCLNTIINLLKNIGCQYKIMNAFDMSKKELDYFVFEGLNKPRVKNCAEYILKNLPNDNLKDYSERKQLSGIEYYVFDDFGRDVHPPISTQHDWVKDYMNEYYHPDMENMKNKWEKLIDKNVNKTINNFPFVGVLNYKTFTNN
jgi:hypothetical protein